MRFTPFIKRTILYNLFVFSFISINAQDVKTYCVKADEHYRNKEYDNAITNYSAAIGIDPNYVYPYVWRGNSYYSKKQFDLAVRDFTQAIKLDPNSIDAYNGRANSYSSKNEYDLAITDYTKMLTLDPAKIWAYANRGYAYSRRNKFDFAIEDYTKAINLDPNYTWAYSQRGFAYSQKKLFESAIKDYSLAIKLGNNTAIAYASRGYAYSMKFDYDSALTDMTKAINLEPTVAGYYNSRGLYFNNLGKYEESVQDFLTCLSKDSNNISAYINIISPMVRIQQLEKASSIYKQFKAKGVSSYLDSEKFRFYKNFILSVTQINEGKLDEAFISLETASQQYGTEIKEETKRGYIDIQFLKGYILERKNKFDDAKIIYEQSLVIDSRQPDIKEALQNIEQKQTQTRSLDNTPPEITLISPAPSRSFDIEADNGKTQIIGKAKDAAGITSIKINNIPVDKIEEDGLFFSNIILKSGINSLTITATDKKGNTATKSFTLNAAAGSNPEEKPDLAKNTELAPKYYAIMIAGNEYNDDNIPDLKNPIKDANDLKILLQTRYTFNAENIDTLYNRSREDIMQAIVLRCNALTENDNLIIFYAGHGTSEKDKFGDVDGYLIPSSARKGLNASYISSEDINKAIKRSNAKHILVIADACFSGALTRALPAETSKEIKKQYEAPSRKVMASGNLEPVPDNSKFIYYLKQALNKNNEKYISAKDLWDSFYKAILSNSDNLPQYSAIKGVGDEGGEFIFIQR
ncbi:MAG: tetratricopeptide repeat protein [Chitinophagaceae bacterium]